MTIVVIAALAACGGRDEATPATKDTTPAVVEGAVRGCAATRDRRASDGADSAVRAYPVNRGTHGMIARTRWIASPDGCAMLVVEDPAAVEAEPVPNGALLVSERGTRPYVIEIDSAWDVAVDSAWTHYAVGRGWVLQGGGEDTVPPARWQALARVTGMDARELESNSFMASGMGYARGVALAFVRPLGAEGPGPARALGPGGWRVRWRHDTLFVGDAPKNAQDYAEAVRWTVHAAPDFQPVAVPSGFAPGPERWAEGPALDIGAQPDSAFGAPRTIALANGRTAQSRGAQVVLTSAGKSERVVGPGALLAATLGGRFILALRPAPKPREYDPKLELVVYEVP